ncbi:site-2 protease family protein [Anaeromyxobacter oryzae]|uniref:site-2 protease family protein n=1 Tax=Anaeromyxobacter oryzae TaxID=2918170 RepID=UPI0020C151CE|nr:site-2 protease family protein [Anaeromyxobacter oryzae]
MATIGGIPIRIHVTFLIVLPFLAFSFGQSFVGAARLAGIPPERLGGPPWAWGLALAVALFASVLVHELAHSLYAVRRGGKVRGITLLMIGGVSELAAPPRSEALMALAGPATSLALGGAFIGVARLFRGELPNVSFAVFYLGQLNLWLGAFNLLPAFPMDGGRVLRGALTRRMGPVRATRIAARFGRGFAVVFAMLGFLTANVLLLLVSFVVYAGAEGEARDVELRAALGDLRVGDVASPLTSELGAGDTLLAVADRMRRERRTAYPVVGEGRVVGIVTAHAVRRVPAERRGDVLAGEVAREATLAAASDRVVDALHVLGRPGAPELVVVVDGGRPVGTLSQLDVERAIELRELEPPPVAGAAPHDAPFTRRA